MNENILMVQTSVSLERVAEVGVGTYNFDENDFEEEA